MGCAATAQGRVSGETLVGGWDVEELVLHVAARRVAVWPARRGHRG